jgi:hypothetical protein
MADRLACSDDSIESVSEQPSRCSPRREDPLAFFRGMMFAVPASVVLWILLLLGGRAVLRLMGVL